MVKLLLFFYNLVWTLFILLFLPFLPLIRKGRIKKRLDPDLPDKPLTKSIWVHALSVGEVLSAIPLIKRIKQQYPQKDIVLTVTTTQGMKIARAKMAGEVTALMTMPLDFWWSVKKMIRCIRPQVFLLVETDLWPCLVFLLMDKEVNALLVNGRISPRTFRSYRRFPLFMRTILNTFNACLMQSELDRERLLRIGMATERVKTVGNVKFDRDWQPMDDEEYRHWLDTLHLVMQDSVWVAGSTHEGEEDILLDTYGKLRDQQTRLKLIIAPRQIERSGDIYRASKTRGFETVLRSRLETDQAGYEILILDTIGELGRVYGIGQISFVGGSLVPSFGCPVLFGPHTHNFVLMSQLLLESGGGIQVKNGEELFTAIVTLLNHPDRCASMGRAAKAFVAMNKGALERIMSCISGYM
ncbi:MAG: 3-deoxy-D-manno-octulosonic acid transferase [Deltaproteobacteria bacterium]|nr:3-deoxy-D-manno-octulosonic acid transferase [Deltaproteobacteria bacterium]